MKHRGTDLTVTLEELSERNRKYGEELYLPVVSSFHRAHCFSKIKLYIDFYHTFIHFNGNLQWK